MLIVAEVSPTACFQILYTPLEILFKITEITEIKILKTEIKEILIGMVTSKIL